MIRSRLVSDVVSAGIKMANESRDLVEELALGPREQGTAQWLVGALELAVGRFDAARVAFEQAERAFLTDDAASTCALMAHGYVALACKADPQSRAEGKEALREALGRLRAQGSKEAIFFADQLSTADRVLLVSD
jgi:cytochrome c-type biogenesis protein CcmH/NrfG